MRIIKHIGISAVVIVCVLALWSGISPAVNVTHSTNPHNLSVGGPTFTYLTEQVCVFCHTPHGGNKQVHESTFWNSSGYQGTSGSGSFLLWNRALANVSSSGYSTYQSSTMQGTPTGQVRAYSLLCMSCHDGVSAINVLSNYPNEPATWWGEDPFAGSGGGLTPASVGGPEKMSDGGSPSINIGERTATSQVVNLANDHPVSFDYTVNLATTQDLGLVVPDNVAGYVGSTAVRLFWSPDTATYSSLECSTCHDPHKYELGYWKPFLVMSNQNSALCLNCHKK